jgi:hypothetical protein
MRRSSGDNPAHVPHARGKNPALSDGRHNTELQANVGKLEGEWTLVDDKHPLSSLQGKAVGSYKVVVMLGTKNRFGARYFRVFIQNSSGELGQQSVLAGLHSQGKYPGYNWIEIISMSPQINFATEVANITLDGLIQPLFKYLADILPPGGHMMVEYDSAEQRDTARSLALGVPPVATPVGAALFLAGCGFGFKDWHFAEGGSEGPRKLQGYKALDSQHAQLKIAQIEEELRTFLAGPSESGSSELEVAARKRASDILNEIQLMAHGKQ